MNAVAPMLDEFEYSAENLFSDQDWQDIIDRVLYVNLDTAGCDMIDIILRQIENALLHKSTDKHVQNMFERKPGQHANFETLQPELKRLYRWQSNDQAGFSNRQKIDGIWQINLWGNEMWLFVEIDGEDKHKQPRVTAKKMWQDVVAGRLNTDQTSVATMRVNLDCVKDKGDVFGAKNVDEQFVYTCIKEIVYSCTHVIVEWIIYNCRERKQRNFKLSSNLQKIIGFDNKTQYDMHFFVGEFYMNVPPVMANAANYPLDKKATLAEQAVMVRSRATRVDCSGTNYARQRNHFKKKDVTFTDKNYRDCTSFNSKVEGRFYVENCLKLQCTCQLRKGQLSKRNGALINYIFVPRVDRQQCHKAVTNVWNKIQDKRTQTGVQLNEQQIQVIVDSEFKGIQGMWYLQDIYDFIDVIKAQWGDYCLHYLKPIFDGGFDPNPNRSTNGQRGANTPVKSIHAQDYLDPRQQDATNTLFNPIEQFFPDVWDSNKKITVQPNNNQYQDICYMVYDYIIEPWMAALENMYHSLIAETLWHITTQGRQGYINNFNKIISRFRRMHFRNQLGIQSRRNLDHAQPISKTGNLRDRLFREFDPQDDVRKRGPGDPDPIKETLDQKLQEYLNENFKADINLVFCRMVQCTNKLALHQLATTYVNGNARIDDILQSFSIGSQSEIMFMLKTIAGDVKIMLNTADLTNTFDDVDPSTNSWRDTDNLKLLLIKYEYPPDAGTVDCIDLSLLFKYKTTQTTEDETFPLQDDQTSLVLTLQQLACMVHKHRFYTQIDFFNGRFKNDEAVHNRNPTTATILNFISDPNLPQRTTEWINSFQNTPPHPEEKWDATLFQDSILRTMRNLLTRQNECATEILWDPKPEDDAKRNPRTIREAFSLKSDNIDAYWLPFVFYTKMHHVAQAAVVSTIDPTDDTNRQRGIWLLQQEPLMADGADIPSVDGCAFWYTLDEPNTENEVRLSEDIVRGYMYYQCLRSFILNVDFDQTALHVTVTDMQDKYMDSIDHLIDEKVLPGPVKTACTDILNATPKGVLWGDKLNYTQQPNQARQCEGQPFWQMKPYSKRTVTDKENEQYFKDKLPRFITLLQLHLGAVMGNLEAVMKTHMLDKIFNDRYNMTRDSEYNLASIFQLGFLKTLDDNRCFLPCDLETGWKPDVLREISLYRRAQDSSRSSIQYQQRSRTVLLPQEPTVQLCSHYVCLRDYGMLRQNKFRQRIWRNRERSSDGFLYVPIRETKQDITDTDHWQRVVVFFPNDQATINNIMTKSGVMVRACIIQRIRQENTRTKTQLIHPIDFFLTDYEPTSKDLGTVRAWLLGDDAYKVQEWSEKCTSYYLDNGMPSKLERDNFAAMANAQDGKTQTTPNDMQTTTEKHNTQIYLYTKPETKDKSSVMTEDQDMWQNVVKWAGFSRQNKLEDLKSGLYWDAYDDIEKRRNTFINRFFDPDSNLNKDHYQNRICPHAEPGHKCPTITKWKQDHPGMLPEVDDAFKDMTVCQYFWQHPKTCTEATTGTHRRTFNWTTRQQQDSTTENSWGMSWKWKYMSITLLQNFMSRFACHAGVWYQITNMMQYCTAPDTPSIHFPATLQNMWLTPEAKEFMKDFTKNAILIDLLPNT